MCVGWTICISQYLTFIQQSGGKYPSLSPTLRRIIVLVYTTQAEYFADQNVILCLTRGRKFKNLSLRLLEDEYFLLITSELTNQSAQKALFICVLYILIVSILALYYKTTTSMKFDREVKEG